MGRHYRGGLTGSVIDFVDDATKYKFPDASPPPRAAFLTQESGHVRVVHTTTTVCIYCSSSSSFCSFNLPAERNLLLLATLPRASELCFHSIMGNDVSRSMANTHHHHTSSMSTPPDPRRPKSTPSPAKPPPRPLFAPSPVFPLASVAGIKRNILNLPAENVRDHYRLGPELGRGQFGVTRVCYLKSTGEAFACKSIAKRKLRCREDVDDVRLEIRILTHLSGTSDHIVGFKGAFEDQHHVHLVMQFCSGGELFHRISSRGKYTERAAAIAFRDIVEVVRTCHSKGVIHRDLKPENFVLLNKDDDAPLMVIDFGLSVFFKPGESFKDEAGSAFYIAPEVIRHNHGPEIDIWSSGIILYIMLSGFPPFRGRTEEDIFESILHDPLDLASPPWPSISASAKDLLRQMLNKNPKERITIDEILNHPWILEAPDTQLDGSVVTRLRQFRATNKLKKLALKFIVEDLSDEEVSDLKDMFQSMDVDGSGTLTVEELRQGLAKQGCLLSESEVQELLNAADADGDGTIDYLEFMTATVQMDKLGSEHRIVSAFQHFDRDNSGFITTEELEEALRKHNIADEEEIEAIIAEVDADKDGRINYEEFAAMMQESML